MFNKLAPDPDNTPALETVNNVFPLDSKINELAPVDTEAVTAPDLIWFNVKSPAVVIG